MMHRYFFACLLLVGWAVFMIVSGNVLAAGSTDRNLKKIVLDNTITYQGHEFYRRFVPRLSEKTGSIYFDSVTLKEFRSSRSGRLITIEHREKVLYRAIVYAGDRYVDAKARQAAVIVGAKLKQAQFDGLLSQGDDLAGDEL